MIFMIIMIMEHYYCDYYVGRDSHTPQALTAVILLFIELT